MANLVERIDDAFTRPAPEDAIRLVKEAVYDEFRGLDPGLGVAATPFFNHAFHPDFMLTWHESGVARERPLYLRFEVADRGSLAVDLTRHDAEQPLFVGMLDHRADIAQEESAPAISAWPITRSLVAEGRAIDVLEDGARAEEGSRVATSALVRSGHGNLSADAGVRLSELITTGFASAAIGHDADLVREAYGELHEFIDDGYADRLATHLQLLWIGSGGEVDELFGVERLDVTALDDFELRQLLEQLLTAEQAPAAGTLRRVGVALDPDRLGRLLGTFEDGHLDALVAANLDRWQAKTKAAQQSEQTAAADARAIEARGKALRENRDQVALEIAKQCRGGERCTIIVDAAGGDVKTTVPAR